MTPAKPEQLEWVAALRALLLNGSRVEFDSTSATGTFADAELPSAVAAEEEKRPVVAALPVWTQAREVVGAQLSKLIAALGKSKNPLAAQLADRGLSGVTHRLQVGLQVALIEFDGAADAAARERTGAQLQLGIAAMRKFLDGDRLLPILEDNPYGVLITLRSTLLEALRQLEKLIPH